MNKTYDIETKVERFHWWFVVRRKILQSLLSSIHLPMKYVTLDIGCGTGANLGILYSTGLNVIGLDRSMDNLLLARKKQNIPFINGSLDKLPIKSNSVGLIVAMDILEHLEDDMNGIHEFYHALVKGGLIILTIPAFQSLWGKQDLITGHKRRYSKKEILEKLSRGGFEVSKSSYFNFFLFLPILLARRIILLLGLKIDSENEINSPLINFFLKTIFSFEPYFLKYFSFPFGVSIFCIARKN